MKDGNRRRALDVLLDLSDVVLLTSEEAKVITGESGPEAAASSILQRPGAKTQWCIVKLGGEGAVLCTKVGDTIRTKGLRVDVSDTVGCGDSFAAAIVMGYIRKHEMDSTMTLAGAVGAATAMGRGAGRNVASAEQVTQLLEADLGAAGSEKHGTTVATALDMLNASLGRARLQGLTR